MVAQKVSDVGWVDLNLGSSTGWWASSTATYRPRRKVEHLKSKSAQLRSETLWVALYIDPLNNISRVDVMLPGLRCQDRDRGYGRADLAQLPALVGGGRRVRLGHRRSKTMWVIKS